MSAPFDIRFGGYQPPVSVHSRGAAVLRDTLAAEVGDAVAFTIDGNITDAGHPAADLPVLIERGELNMGYFLVSYFAHLVPEIALLDLPFLARDRAHSYGVIDGPLGALIAEKLAAASGFRVLGWWDNGFRHLSNRVRPIHTPADCRGLRLRIGRSDTHVRSFSAMGFEPVFIDVKDLPAAVAAGTVDAQENPLTNLYNFALHKTHRYVTLSSHLFGATALVCNKDVWDGWPDEIREAVGRAVTAATVAQRGFAAAADDEILAKLDPAENEVVRLSADQRATFAAAVAPVIDDVRATFGEELFGYLA